MKGTWEFGNDWKSLRRNGGQLCLIELDIHARCGDWLYVHAALLGFRVTYERWVPVESLGRDS